MLILVLGGARSGKSAVAESLTRRLPQPVTYVATLTPDERDADLICRIEAHRRRRPASWATLDATEHLADQLRGIAGTVLVDSLGPWVARHQPDDARTDLLRDALAARAGDSVVVSDEVGLSVHPSTAAGRAFRDLIGTLNQRLAAAADDTLLIVAGRVLATAPIDAATIVGSA